MDRRRMDGLSRVHAIVWAAFAAAALALFLATAGRTYAKTPSAEGDIPVFAGAVRDAAAEKEELQSRKEGMAAAEGGRTSGEVVREKSSSLRIYRSDAPPEEVFQYYRKVLGAAADDGSPTERPKPGGVTPVRYRLTFHPEETFQDRSGQEGEWPGRMLQSAIAKDRKPLEPGKWLYEALFGWEKVESNGDETGFLVRVLDVGIRTIGDPSRGETKVVYRRGTRIEVERDTAMGTEAFEREKSEAASERLDRETEERTRRLSGKPPTEKEMGVPPYPGAWFDARNSAGMTQDDYPAWIFLTNDPVKTVVAFYEGRTGKKAQAAGQRAYILALVGEMPIPEHGVTVQPNTMFPGKYKTAVTIMRKVR